MSSTDATPCSSRKIASSRAAPRIRLATKPGISLRSTTGCLPSCSVRATTVSTVASDVSGPRTTSTQRITSAGLKKCMLATRSGRPVASAICDDMIADEFVVRIACGGATLSSRAKTSRLTSSFSTAASITRSAPAAAASRSVLKVSRAKAASTSSRVRRPFATSRSSRACSWDRARSSASSVRSVTVVSWPASAQTMAICAPIVPAPTTRIERTRRWVNQTYRTPRSLRRGSPRHTPLKVGGRFSRNALAPSALSAVV